MKMKTKMFTLMEIAIVLCSMFLVALPAIAAEQNLEMQKVSASTITSASEDDFVLGIYGNANEDDTIDMRDLTYVKLIFFGKKPETKLADAKYDGKINPLDFIQIKLIIVGKEKELTIEDGLREAVTVHKPVKRVVVEWKDTAELMRTLNSADKIVGVTSYINKYEQVYFPELSKLPDVGLPWNLDYEAVLSLNPDLFLTFGATTAEKKEKLPGVAVVFLGLYLPDLLNPEGSRYTDGVKKLGYILDKKEDAEEFANWRIGEINRIKSQTERLSEDEKPRVFLYNFPKPGKYHTYAKGDKFDQMCLIAGGRNIAEDLPEYLQGGYSVDLDPEWVVAQNPDFIIVQAERAEVVHGYSTDDPSEMAAIREEIMNRPELANVKAVKTGDVYILWCDSRNDGTSGSIGAAYMAKLFCSDLFEDLDPQAIHQEYLDRFQQFDFNVCEHGVFVYPPLED